MIEAIVIMCAAVERYKQLSEGNHQGKLTLSKSATQPGRLMITLRLVPLIIQ